MTARPGCPLAGYRIGVTAARKVEEQVGLLERRGASVRVGAGAVDQTPTTSTTTSLRAATAEVLERAGRPVPGHDRHRDEDVVRRRRGRRHDRRAARPPRRRRDPGARPQERRGAAPARAARAVGAGVGGVRRRPGAPARARPERQADRRAGARPVAVDGRPRAAPARRRRARPSPSTASSAPRTRADVPPGRRDRRPHRRTPSPSPPRPPWPR